jgi:hypothetical protein
MPNVFVSAKSSYATSLLTYQYSLSRAEEKFEKQVAIFTGLENNLSMYMKYKSINILMYFGK